MNDKKPLHNKNVIDAFYNAFNGIVYATSSQKNVKRQLLIIAIVMSISLFFQLSKVEFLLLIFSVILIIIAEMVNTAIETVVDLCTEVYNEKAKIAKDVGAGAVVISAINSAIVIYFLLYDKVINIGETVINGLINSPVHLAFAGIVLTVIAIIALKAANIRRRKKGVDVKFIPSGQAALAFSAVVAVSLISKNVAISALSTLLAIMICANRIDNNKRSLLEVIFGGCIGGMVMFFICALTLFVK
jgi:diacylglycerol kinase (ATP)